MFNPFDLNRSCLRVPLKVMGAACLALAIACGGGGGGSNGGGGGTPAVPFAELLFVADQASIRSVNATGTTRTELGTATIPGIPGTYARAGSFVTVTMPRHGIRNGLWVEFVFSAGTGGTATSGKYKITRLDDDSFTLTDTASGTITGGTLLRKPGLTFPSAAYAQTGTALTVTLPGHGLIAGDQVNFQFTSGAATIPTRKIASVTTDTFTVTMPAAATTSGSVLVSIGNNYSIFDLAMHPSGKWLYATSFYDCPLGDPYCWGGELISRFAIDWTTGALTLQESVRAQANSNYGAPVALVFSPDGTRMFNQDDDLDGVKMWNVNTSTGALTFVAETAPDVTRAHGLAVSADGTKVYHASNVFTVGPASITLSFTPAPAAWDNSNLIVNNVLYGARTSWAIKTYSLANPAAPAETASAATTGLNEARAIAVSSSGSLIVSSGWGGLKSFTFNGTAIAPVAAVAGELRDGGAPWPVNNTIRRMYRSLSLNKDGNLLAASYFTNYPNNAPTTIYSSGAPSGYVLVSLAADGSLALVSDTTNLAYSRVAKFFRKP